MCFSFTLMITSVYSESLLKGKDKKFQLRGHKEKNFTLIYKCACPCVLTENFFYDNEDECKFMLSNEGLDRIVKLHVEFPQIILSIYSPYAIIIQKHCS